MHKTSIVVLLNDQQRAQKQSARGSPLAPEQTTFEARSQTHTIHALLISATISVRLTAKRPGACVSDAVTVDIELICVGDMWAVIHRILEGVSPSQ